jgi:hypothetical protein
MRLEADADVEGEPVIGETFWGKDGFLISETEVEIIQQASAEAASDGGLSHAVCAGGTEVDDIVTLAGERDVVAFHHHRKGVKGNEGDEPAAGVVVGHDRVVSDEALLIGIKRDAQTAVGAEVEITKAFLGGDKHIQLTIAAALEDIGATGGDVDSEAGGEDELGSFVIDQSIFETEGEVHPAIGIAYGVIVDLEEAVLGGDQGQAVSEGIADLHRVKLGVATAEEAVIDAMVCKDGADLRADDRVFEEDRIRDGRDGVVFPTHRIHGGRRSGGDGGRTGLRRGEKRHGRTDS